MLDIPVEIEGVVFNSGDLVFADDDGVVSSPKNYQKEAISAAWAKVNAENITREAIKDGMKATEAYEKFGVL
ncbi:MAG: hypothetical protein ACFHHU_13695 [Porticoccaceae bacterium]